MNQKYNYLIIIAAAASVYLIMNFAWAPEKTQPATYSGTNIRLPEPRYFGNVSVEEALFTRRSQREYSPDALTLEDVSQILWAAQGITSGQTMRTAPSAGGTYPLELYVVVGNVREIDPGVYRYNPKNHSLTKIKKGDNRKDLQAAALSQSWVGDAAFDVAITGAYNKTTRVYGERGIRYVHMEAGHTSQNIYLQAESMGLGTVAVGAFDDKKVIEILNATENETPLYIMPIGKKIRPA